MIAFVVKRRNDQLYWSYADIFVPLHQAKFFVDEKEAYANIKYWKHSYRYQIVPVEIKEVGE